MHDRDSKKEAFGQLLDIMDTLREQCPWDRKQTFESLRPLTIEETYELSQALEDKHYDEVCKELGDLIMHIVFYAKVADQQGLFDIQDVLEKTCAKLKYRHPHIYGDVQVKTADDVSDNWEKLKLKEKDGNRTVLSGVPQALPSMIKALRMQDKAHGVAMRLGIPLKYQMWETGAASSMCPILSRRTLERVTSTPHLSQMIPL